MTRVSADLIEELHRELNSLGRVPERYYRRNVIQYELVSYIATLVALWTSRNFAVLHAFLHRASDALDRLRPDLDGGYAELVDAYLRRLTQYLASSNDLSDELKSSLPPHLLQERS